MSIVRLLMRLFIETEGGTSTSSQADVYEKCGFPLVQHILNGINCSLIAYGRSEILQISIYNA